MRVVVAPPSSSSTSTSSGPLVRESWEPTLSSVFSDPIGPEVNSVFSNDENERFKWSKYLADISARGRLSHSVTDNGLAVWKFLLEQVPTIRTPHAGPTEDGGLQMVWDRERHHLEIEISPSGRYDWFYRDRQADKHWDGENCTVGDYSDKFRSVIRSISPEPQDDLGATTIEVLAIAGG